MKLFVTDYGSVKSDGDNFEDITVKEFINKLGTKVDYISFIYDETNGHIGYYYDGMVTDKGNDLYKIKYLTEEEEKKVSHEFNFDISQTGLYYPMLKENLDKLAAKTSENTHIDEVTRSFNTGNNSHSVEDIKLYLKLLKRFKKLLMRKNFFRISLWFLSPIFILLTKLTNFALFNFLTICSFGFTTFLVLYALFDFRYYSKYFIWHKAIKSKIDLISTYLQRMGKADNYVTTNKNDATSETKNDNVSIYERMVVNSSSRIYQTLANVSDEERKKMIRELQSILDEYLVKKNDIPKLATKDKINDYEALIAMNALVKIKPLSDRIKVLTGQEYESMPIFTNCSDVRNFISNQNTPEGKEQEVSSGKVLTRSLGNGVSG